jgi:hypothetical protein
MPAFPRFDPFSVLSEDNPSRGGAPAKVANPAKAGGTGAGTLANLATLAAGAPEIEDPRRRPKAPAKPEQPTVLAPRQWYEKDSAADEPPYDKPCPARCGVIRYPRGRFEHFCAVCGAWGAYGYGVTGEKPGRWFCFHHRKLDPSADHGEARTAV